MKLLHSITHIERKLLVFSDANKLLQYIHKLGVLKLRRYQVDKRAQNVIITQDSVDE